MTEQEEKRKRPESGMSAGVTAALIALILAVTAGVLALLYFTALRPLLQKREPAVQTQGETIAEQPETPAEPSEPTPAEAGRAGGGSARRADGGSGGKDIYARGGDGRHAGARFTALQ